MLDSCARGQLDGRCWWGGRYALECSCNGRLGCVDAEGMQPQRIGNIDGVVALRKRARAIGSRIKGERATKLTAPQPGTRARPAGGTTTAPDSITSRKGGWMLPASQGVRFACLVV